MVSIKNIECKTCLMSFDEKFIDSSGECIICREYRKKWLYRDYKKSEMELLEIFDHYKKRNKDNKYDAIVAFTGGKDSSYALYLAAKKYGLRPLAVTADNGLLAPVALKNMKQITNRLGVDHLIVSRDKDELRSIYRAFFRKTKNFCEVCYLTILSSLGMAAVENDVPLIISGAAFKIDSSHFRAATRYCVEDAVINTVKDRIPKDVLSKYISKNVRADMHFHLLHIYDYVDHVEKEIYKVLEDELGWDSMKREDKHADCKFHHMLGYLRSLSNDTTSLVFMTPAALLRSGQITAEEHREMLAKEKTLFRNIDKKQIDEFLDFFDIDEDFLTAELESPKLTQPLISEKDFSVLFDYREQPGISEREVIDRLFEIIRPELERDGGDIKILEYKDSLLKIELLGGCRACYMADVVMMRYLEYLVRTYVSRDIIIENVKKLVPIAS